MQGVEVLEKCCRETEAVSVALQHAPALRRAHHQGLASVTLGPAQRGGEQRASSSKHRLLSRYMRLRAALCSTKSSDGLRGLRRCRRLHAVSPRTWELRDAGCRRVVMGATISKQPRYRVLIGKRSQNPGERGGPAADEPAAFISSLSQLRPSMS